MNIRIECMDWERACDAATAIRTAVFVDEQGVPAELEIDADDPLSLHALAYVDAPMKGQRVTSAVATARLLADGHIGRMAVLPACRGQGIGRALLERLITAARDRGMDAIVLNAQIQAMGFYTRCGFVIDSSEFMEAGIAHRRMRWAGVR